MTTAYAQRAQQECELPPPGHLRLVSNNTAPAQGPEAIKVSEIVVRTFARGTAGRGQSAESEKVLAVVRQLQREMTQFIENVCTSRQAEGYFSYNHIPVKPVFSVKVTYKHIGKLKPRHFPLDE